MNEAEARGRRSRPLLRIPTTLVRVPGLDLPQIM